MTDPLEELAQLLTGTLDETPDPAREVRPQHAETKILDAWRSGDPTNWQTLLFGTESPESEANRFDEMDREAGAPVGTLREAWAMARAKAGRHKT